MTTLSAEEMKNRTIETLIDPDGGIRLAVLETRPVRNLTGNVPGLLWYLEDEGIFIVERAGPDRLEIVEYPTVDSLIADDWVLSAPA